MISASTWSGVTNGSGARGVPVRRDCDESLTLESALTTEWGDVEQCVEADEPRTARWARLAA